VTRAVPAPSPGPAPGTGVQSVERALDLLEVLAADGPLGLTEAAAGAGLAEGTAHRLLRTLLDRGYVRQDGDRRYAPGTRLLGLGDGARGAVAAASRPYLARLVQLSGETANLAVLEGDHVVYVAQVPSAHRLRLFAEVGRHVPAHSTAVGKVLLGGLDVEATTALLRRTGLARRTPRTFTSVAEVLAAVRTAATAGYAVDDEEEETGVRCHAVPVLDGDRVVAALSVSGPSTRVAAAPAPALVEGLRAVAAEFAAAVSPRH